MALDRRTFVGGAALGAAVPMPSRAADLNLSDPARNLSALMKIIGSTDPSEIAIGYGSGRVYACFGDATPVPLFGTHSVSVIRTSANEDGTFRKRERIVGFRTAFETETVIKSMTNPVSGENIELPFTDYGVGNTEYLMDGTYAIASDGRRIKLSAYGPRPWAMRNGVVALSDDTSLPGPADYHPKVDAVTRYAAVEDLADPMQVSPKSWFNFSAVDPFRAWLKMPAPGFQLWHLSGEKVRRPGELPTFTNSVISEEFPDLFDLPEL